MSGVHSSSFHLSTPLGALVLFASLLFSAGANRRGRSKGSRAKRSANLRMKRFFVKFTNTAICYTRIIIDMCYKTRVKCEIHAYIVEKLTNLSAISCFLNISSVSSILLSIEPPAAAGGSEDGHGCSDPETPGGNSAMVLRARRRRAAQWRHAKRAESARRVSRRRRRSSIWKREMIVGKTSDFTAKNNYEHLLTILRKVDARQSLF